MNARIRRLAIVLALAGSALAGASAATAVSLGTEATNRAGLSNCVLVDEVVKFGRDPLVLIPETTAACNHYRALLRVTR